MKNKNFPQFKNGILQTDDIELIKILDETAKATNNRFFKRVKPRYRIYWINDGTGNLLHSVKEL